MDLAGGGGAVLVPPQINLKIVVNIVSHGAWC